ncbi:MAG: hypothetical protein R3C53_07890 [Pirellulaceae bacterium]
MTRPHDVRSSFRCTIAPEDSAAVVKISGKKFNCSVVNTSRDGFGIRVPCKLAKQLKKAKRVELVFRNERWQVKPVSEFSEDGKTASVGLVRIVELTKINLHQSIGFSSVPKFSPGTDPSFLVALVVAFLLTCVCLPGIGTHLGTAPKIRDGVSYLMRTVAETMN